MPEQLIIDMDGKITTKLEIAIQRLRAFEPEDGYFVAFSGGKDSQCIYHLCEMAGVKFDAHYSVTSVDPPELIHFIRKHYPDVIFDVPHDSNGRRISMWNLIAELGFPPTRLKRYCCQALKEYSGKGRIVVTGVRWAESARRRAIHGIASIVGKPKGTQTAADLMGAEYFVNKAGALVLNDDNDPSRRMVEQCYRTQKVIVNPIVDWEEEEVWRFLNHIAKAPHCKLYDEGFKRIGCIGCLMANQAREFERWPKYKELYLSAFERMIRKREIDGKDNLHPADWSTREKVMRWWMEEKEAGTDDDSRSDLSARSGHNRAGNFRD